MSVAAAVLSAVIVFIQQKIVNKLTLQMLDEFRFLFIYSWPSSNLNHIAEEILSNIRTVHLFFQFPRAKESYTRYINIISQYFRSADSIFRFKRKIAVATGVSETAYEISFMVAMVGCIWLGSKMVHNYHPTNTKVISGEIDFGNLTAWALIAENTLVGGGT